MDTNDLSLRDLQKETARALSVLKATNNNLSQFNHTANHDSQNWYKSVLKWYVDQYGDLPSKAGPGKTVRLLNE